MDFGFLFDNLEVVAGGVSHMGLSYAGVKEITTVETLKLGKIYEMKPYCCNTLESSFPKLATNAFDSASSKSTRISLCAVMILYSLL